MTDPKYPKTVAARWTATLDEGGWTPVVNAFLEHGGRRKGLGLNPTQCMLIIQLIYHKRDVRLPNPGIKKLATRLGLTDTTVRNNLDTLARKGLIAKRLRRGDTTFYNLAPLFKRLENFQRQAAEKRARDKPEEVSSTMAITFSLTVVISPSTSPPIALTRDLQAAAAAELRPSISRPIWRQLLWPWAEDYDQEA